MADGKLYVTLPIDPSNGWQPTNKPTGQWGQYLTTGPWEYAVESRIRRYPDGTSIGGVVFYGPWDERDARRYAWSMADGAVDTESGPHVYRVEPYYYCQVWGRVPAASVHALDPVCYRTWAELPAGSGVLGSDDSPAPARVAV